MDNETVYKEFVALFEQSVKDKTFAKLTLAKTIGKPQLLNIFVRLHQENNVLKLRVTKKIYDEGLQEIDNFISIENLYNTIIPFMNNPFMSAILFTTENDIFLKLNKKRVASIQNQPASFKNPDVLLQS
jgi:hypothetical protein